jgi:hypothetical protein
MLHANLPPTMWVWHLATIRNFEIETASDHLPHCITYAISDYIPSVPCRLMHPIPKRLDILLTHEPTVEKYNTILQRTLHKCLPVDQVSPACCGDVIAVICRASVEAVQSLSPHILPTPKRARLIGRPQRTRHKKGMSTEARIRQTYLHFYTMLLRAAFPKGRRRRLTSWTPHSHRTLLTNWIVTWTIKHASIHAAMVPPIDLQHPRHLFSLRFEELTEAHFKQQRALIKKSLHGTFRTQMQASANIRHMDVLTAHNSKQLGRVIQLLTAQPPQHCDLHTLHCPTEGQITDHYRVHSKVTDFFSNWYQAPTDMDPSTEALTMTPDWWKQLLTPHCDSQPFILHPNSSIPPHLQSGLRKACAIKASPEIQREIQASIDTIITYEEFSAAIDSLRAGSAPGPSETTPSMLLAWNPAIRHFVYQHMLKVW